MSDLETDASADRPNPHSGRDPYLFFGAIAVGIAFGAGLILPYFVPSPPWVRYLVGVSVSAFVMCLLDKGFAKTDKLRVPEMVLYAVAVAGGTPGLLIGMKLFRHKTSKAQFHVGLVFLIVVQIAILKYLLKG